RQRSTVSVGTVNLNEEQFIMTSMDNIDLIDKKSCRVVVHRARNLKPRGKDSKSSPFVTICLGKEKFATSVIEKSQNPEWNEDCELIHWVQSFQVKTVTGQFCHEKRFDMDCPSKGLQVGTDSSSPRFLPGEVPGEMRPLMEVEAAPKRSIRGWYKLLGKGSKTKKEDKNRGEIEITAQMKGDSNRSILPTAINVKSFARLDVHPLRKATSTPYIASHDDTSTNPFAETPNDNNLELSGHT
ncbi:putative rab11 family-interacting protein 2-like, partial [Apostichopus japonicus]